MVQPLRGPQSGVVHLTGRGDGQSTWPPIAALLPLLGHLRASCSPKHASPPWRSSEHLFRPLSVIFLSLLDSHSHAYCLVMFALSCRTVAIIPNKSSESLALAVDSSVLWGAGQHDNRVSHLADLPVTHRRCWTWTRHWCTARWTAATSPTSASRLLSTGGNTACTCAADHTCSPSWSAARSCSRSSSSPPPRRSTRSSSSTSSTPPGAHPLFPFCIYIPFAIVAGPGGRNSWKAEHLIL